ncbi:MAG: hypothetical protein H6837_15365 [Planctomycetes bacterium]|nr:hypothetical protein [Planctomycetota bacterium]
MGDTALGGFVAGKVQGRVGVNLGKVRDYLAQVKGSDSYAIAIVKAVALHASWECALQNGEVPP